MALYALGPDRPNTQGEGSCWVAPGAHVIGRVDLGRDVGIWFGAVVRGDNDPISIGEGTNVQDGAMLHADPGFPLRIGRFCTIGHHAIVHGCTLGDTVLVGMGATLLNGAEIGRNSLVGANALVTEGKSFPEGVLIIGAPAKVVRELTPVEIEGLKASADRYIANAARFRQQLSAL